MKRILLGGSLGMALALPVQAIVNVEDLRMDTSKAGLSASVSVNFAGKSGNTENLQGGLSSGVQYVQHPDQLKRVELLLLSYDYAESAGKRYDESQFWHVRHTQFFTKQWAWEAYAQYEATPFVLDKKRALLGGGVLWERNRKDFSGHLGASIFYENEQVDLGKAETFETYRFNWMAKGQSQLSKNASAGVGLYFQPEVSDWSNNRTIASLALNSKLKKAWSLQTSVTYKHDSQPYLSLKSDDWSYGMGINYRY